jgi:hypothetical protein
LNGQHDRASVTRQLACFLGLAALLLVVTAPADPEPRAMRAVAQDPRVQSPREPSPYPLPRGATRVSTSAGLVAALSTGRARDIVLSDGVYARSRPFVNLEGHRIYAEHRGRAVLRAGLVFGGNWGGGGGLVRGVVFDVSDRSKTANGAIVFVWGAARGTRVVDSVLRGHGRIPAGIMVLQPAGFVGKRLTVRGFTDYGVRVDANDPGYPATAKRSLLEDLDVRRVARPRPGSSNGTAEACVWIGNKTTLRRLRARRCAREGLWTGGKTRRSLFVDVDVDRSPTGVYIEHFTSRSVFRRMKIGPRVRIGVATEWADPAYGGIAGSVNNLIEQSVFRTRVVGVAMDYGTVGTTIRRSTFVSQCWAAIQDHHGVDNAYYRNAYRRIDAGARPLTRQHLSALEDDEAARRRCRR